MLVAGDPVVPPGWVVRSFRKKLVVHAERLRLGNAPRHENFAPHAIPEPPLALQHQHSVAALRHRLRERGPTHPAPDRNDVVVRRHYFTGFPRMLS
jgi:hypothetical protein